MARKCKYCKTEIPKVSDCGTVFQKKGYCDVDHMAKHGLDKSMAAKEKKARKEHREAKERIKSRGDYAKEAQAEFNRFIRMRDYGKNCISCQKPPKKKNAGHYRSVGAAPELRFEPLNCHLQCEHCNTYLSSNAIEYRINLVKKIGLNDVEWLEGPHNAKKYTINDLKEIKALFRKMANEQEKINNI